MRKRNWLYFMLLIVLVLTAGCGSADNTVDGKPAQAQQEKKDSAAFPVTVTDSTGTEIVLDKRPERIVSIVPSNTEILFALGLGKNIVGVSDWDNYPEEVKNIEKVGGLDVNTEKVVSLKPDLIFANSSNRKSIQPLRDLGLKVLVVDAKNLEETFSTIQLIAKVTGTEEQAKELIENMKEERDQVVQAVEDIPLEERKKVWIEIDPELYTAGKNTFMNELLQMAGGHNIASELEGWPKMNQESVISANPDVIFVTYGFYIENAKEMVKQRESWKGIAAVKNRQVYDLDSDLINRPGPRIIEGLKQIATYLYPERFKSDQAGEKQDGK